MLEEGRENTPSGVGRQMYKEYEIKESSKGGKNDGRRQVKDGGKGGKCRLLLVAVSPSLSSPPYVVLRIENELTFSHDVTGSVFFLSPRCLVTRLRLSRSLRVLEI